MGRPPTTATWFAPCTPWATTHHPPAQPVPRFACDLAVLGNRLPDREARSQRDLDPRREAIEGFHVDENEYHLGLETFAGERKPAWHRFRDLLASPVAGRPDPPLSRAGSG